VTGTGAAAGSRGGTLQRDPGAQSWAVHRPGGRDVALMAVAVVGVSFSGPLTALVATSFLAIAFWRNAAGAVLLLPVLLLRERSTLTGLRARPGTAPRPPSW
jgi:Flp pilus assembly protein protease CpaA